MGDRFRLGKGIGRALEGCLSGVFSSGGSGETELLGRLVACGLWRHLP